MNLNFTLNNTLLLIFGSFGLFILSCGDATSSLTQANQKLPEQVDFNYHIKPILSDRCFQCHGPDENTRKADLRLDLEEHAFALLDSAENRYAIVAGDLDKSSLYQRISSKDPEIMMPPPESNLKISDYEIALIEKWIKQGAQWKAHWAFIAPEKGEFPKVSNKKWGLNAIDDFILNRLEREGLNPSEEATKEKLIRRLSFDLRGMPPTLDEIDTFLNDDSAEAYDKLIDQFLSEESFGERMAMEWMDLSRYADSHGYQDDLERSMWPWRDWIIKAFNENMPYDQFVTWQLAGDLLPDASYEQKLATGFNRNHKITQEVGVINEEYRVNYVLDRVNTFSTAFLGLTVECAQCHDHKFDPISQKEFFSLFSFFNNVPEKGRVEYGVEVAEPYLPLPEEKVESIKAYVDDLFTNQQNKVENYYKEAWEKGFEAPKINQAPSNEATVLPKGLVAWYPLDYIENEQTPELIKQSKASGINDLIPVKGKFSGALEFTGYNSLDLEASQGFNFDRPFTISLWVKSLDGGINGTLIGTETTELAMGFAFQVSGEKHLWITWTGNNGKKLQIRSGETFPENKWVHLTLTHDGSRSEKGVDLYMDGKLLHTYVLRDDLRGAINYNQKLLAGTQRPIYEEKKKKPTEEEPIVNNPRGLVGTQLDELLLFNRALKETEIEEIGNYDPLSKLYAKSDKNETDLKRLFHHQMLQEDAAYQMMTERLREYKIRTGRIEDIIIRPTMIMGDLDTIRPTFVLDRGQYDAPAERVETGTPKAVLAFEDGYSKNRKGLSEWLFDEANPLTARVAVNRFWQIIFGKGIVATPGDFGSQGALPSHPELLDWLAIEYRESGWDTKHILRLILQSATYRQSAESNAKIEQVDPDNVLLAHAPQVRLSAEMVRDHALAISGLLSDVVGGPSVKPYQPEGLWLAVASGNQSLRKYIQDHDQDLYRRSLYTFWKRTIPPPSMMVFDAPSREECVIKRPVTNTPMQALVLLNDPQFVESSRLIATRMLKEGGTDDNDKIQFAFRLATSRKAIDKELTVLENLLNEQRKEFKNNPDAAKELITVGEYPVDESIEASELAAFTIVANAVLNLAESIQKN